MQKIVKYIRNACQNVEDIIDRYLTFCNVTPKILRTLPTLTLSQCWKEPLILPPSSPCPVLSHLPPCPPSPVMTAGGTDDGRHSPRSVPQTGNHPLCIPSSVRRQGHRRAAPAAAAAAAAAGPLQEYHLRRVSGSGV